MRSRGTSAGAFQPKCRHTGEDTRTHTSWPTRGGGLTAWRRSFADAARRYVPIVRAHAPSAEVWAGEDGPTGGGDSGACGSDETSICGLYGSILWYASDMGLRAQHGFTQYQRQDLVRHRTDGRATTDALSTEHCWQVGGRYSLVGMGHDNEFLEERDPGEHIAQSQTSSLALSLTHTHARTRACTCDLHGAVLLPPSLLRPSQLSLPAVPAVTLHADFWVNFLWKRLVGPHVLNTTVTALVADPEAGGESVRGYVHCGAAPSPFRANGTGSALTAILINLDNLSSTELTIESGASWFTTGTAGPTDPAAAAKITLVRDQIPALRHWPRQLSHDGDDRGVDDHHADAHTAVHDHDHHHRGDHHEHIIIMPWHVSKRVSNCRPSEEMIITWVGLQESWTLTPATGPGGGPFGTKASCSPSPDRQSAP